MCLSGGVLFDVARWGFQCLSAKSCPWSIPTHYISADSAMWDAVDWCNSFIVSKISSLDRNPYPYLPSLPLLFLFSNSHPPTRLHLSLESSLCRLWGLYLPKTHTARTLMCGLSAAHTLTHSLLSHWSILYAQRECSLSLFGQVLLQAVALQGPFNQDNSPLQCRTLDKHLRSTGSYLVVVRENHDDITDWNVGVWQPAAVYYQRGRGAQEPLWEKMLIHSLLRTHETLGCKIWQSGLRRVIDLGGASMNVTLLRLDLGLYVHTWY